MGWDDPGADPDTLSPFVARGFVAIDDVALAFDGTELHRGRGGLDGDLRLQRLDLRREASGVLACELAVDADRRDPYGSAAIGRNLAWSRELVAGGEVGGWYGAELDGQLVATLGIVSVGGEGRLQSVGTHPRFRNRGIGRALVAWAWRDAAARFDLDRLMLVTSRGGDAERFYRRMGFRAVGGSLGVLRC